MHFLGLILALVIFPLNSLLFWADSSAWGKESEDISPVDRPLDFKSGKEQAKIWGNSFPIAQYQPVRKENTPDLVISNAHASLILDAGSGTILHYDQGRQERQIASLTKIMTAVLVMENIKDLDELVTIDEEVVYVDGTKIGCPRSGYCISQRLRVGEKISVRNLLKAMLINSANDAATALGKHIGGTVDNFAKIMNERAKELGLEDSHFCTPSGLEKDGAEETCYSSAYDIARIAAYSLKFGEIWNIFKLPSNTVVASADGQYEHTLLNTDLLIDEMPNLIGGKTGFTPLAGRSLLMAIQDEDQKHTIITVLLDDPYRWQDVKIMADWAFSSFEWQ